jgi:DNA repair photolyase
MKLPGQKLMSRDFGRRTAELQTRIAILNRLTELGIPVMQPVG